MTDEKYCLVAVNSPFNNSILSYSEGSFAHDLNLGDLVTVPLGKREEKGCVIKTGLSLTDLPGDIDKDKIKSVSGSYTTTLSVDKIDLQLFRWVSEYYRYPVGQHIFDCLPKISKRPRPLKFEKGDGKKLDFQFSPEQDSIITTIKSKLSKGFSKWLVHGITGSGKTVIYLNLIKEVIQKNQSILFLLPEINLTPQFTKTFEEYLDIPIYSYSSAVTNSSKFGLWKLLQTDDTPKIIIGVRSSIFLPIKKLGLIIVDEEHDQSFKQEDRCTYNARDVAIKKAHLNQIPIVLGSATPSVETFHHFKNQNSSNYLTLKKRISNVTLPEIELVDMRIKEEDSSLWPFNSRSMEEITKALERKEQVLVFVNRLGHANFIQCRACGLTFTCPNCSINLKFFRKRNTLECQYCDYKTEAPQICPDCGNMSLHQKGFGTEKLHQILTAQFPDKVVERFDRDEIKTFKQLSERLNEFHNFDVDILVGTQMVSKGHNFKNVNLVLILGMDSQLNFPDFRALEKVHQLLAQVSGRSGRYGKKSKVLIHTMSSENQLFQYIINHSFDNFYTDEISIRELCQLPPFAKIGIIYFSSKHQDKVVDTANKAVSILNFLSNKCFKSIEILGPRATLIEKKVNKFTWSIMLKSNNINEIHNILNNLQSNLNKHYSVSMKIDIDPYHLH